MLFCSKVCEGPDHTFAKVITPGVQNTKVPILMLIAHPPHAPEVLPMPLHRQLSHLCVDTTSHMAKMGLVTRMEILWRNIATGPCKSCLKGKQPHHRIHEALVTCAGHTLGIIFLDVCGLLATHISKKKPAYNCLTMPYYALLAQQGIIRHCKTVVSRFFFADAVIKWSQALCHPY